MKYRESFLVISYAEGIPALPMSCSNRASMYNRYRYLRPKPTYRISLNIHFFG